MEFLKWVIIAFAILTNVGCQDANKTSDMKVENIIESLSSELGVSISYTIERSMKGESVLSLELSKEPKVEEGYGYVLFKLNEKLKNNNIEYHTIEVKDKSKHFKLGKDEIQFIGELKHYSTEFIDFLSNKEFALARDKTNSNLISDEIWETLKSDFSKKFNSSELQFIGFTKNVINNDEFVSLVYLCDGQYLNTIHNITLKDTIVYGVNF